MIWPFLRRSRAGARWDACAAFILFAAPPAALAQNAAPAEDYLQCVPYTRKVSKIAIYGDAWTWWQQAEGRYVRGVRPKVGAVLAMPRYRNMALGHVATVSRIIDARTILLRHANWSPIAGLRGRVEDDVPAVDVSPGNDWSEVRVWFAPLGELGRTRWPVSGFIYNEPVGVGAPQMAVRQEKDATALDKLPVHRAEAVDVRSDPIGDIIAQFAAARHARSEPQSHQRNASNDAASGTTGPRPR